MCFFTTMLHDTLVRRANHSKKFNNTTVSSTSSSIKYAIPMTNLQENLFLVANIYAIVYTIIQALFVVFKIYPFTMKNHRSLNIITIFEFICESLVGILLCVLYGHPGYAYATMYFCCLTLDR